MTSLEVTCKTPHLFYFRLQVTWIALLTEQGFLESLNDSSFHVAVHSWWKLFEGVEMVSMAMGTLLQEVLYRNVKLATTKQQANTRQHSTHILPTMVGKLARICSFITSA